MEIETSSGTVKQDVLRDDVLAGDGVHDACMIEAAIIRGGEFSFSYCVVWVYLGKLNSQLNTARQFLPPHDDCV